MRTVKVSSKHIMVGDIIHFSGHRFRLDSRSEMPISQMTGVALTLLRDDGTDGEKGEATVAYAIMLDVEVVGEDE